MTSPTTQLTLEAGSYWICTCGASKNWPYCDGAHRGSAFQPLNLELPTPSTVEISGTVNTATAQRS